MWATHPHTLPHSSPAFKHYCSRFRGRATWHRQKNVKTSTPVSRKKASTFPWIPSNGQLVVTPFLDICRHSSYLPIVHIWCLLLSFTFVFCCISVTPGVLDMFCLLGSQSWPFCTFLCLLLFFLLLFIRFLFVPWAHPKRPSDPCMTALSPLWPVWVLYDRFEPSTTGLSPVWPVWALYDRFESCMTGLRGHAASLVRSRSIGEQNNRLNESNSNHDAKSNSCCT